MPKDKKEKKNKIADADVSVVADDAEMEVDANGQVRTRSCLQLPEVFNIRIGRQSRIARGSFTYCTTPCSKETAKKGAQNYQERYAPMYCLPASAESCMMQHQRIDSLSEV
jgi:hypothetical protein